MAKIELKYDDTDVSRLMRTLASEQVPYATQLTINDAAEAFQKAQRQHQRDVFEVRNPGFVDRAVKIRPFASVTKQGRDIGRLHATVSIDPPGGQERAGILTKFEDQRTKRPIDPGGSIAIPEDDVPRRRLGGVRKAWRPRSLQAKRGRRTKSGKLSKAQGTQTFRGTVRGLFGIFERTGDGVRLLYRLLKSVPIEPDLDFQENAERIVPPTLAARFAVNFERAVRTRRR